MSITIGAGQRIPLNRLARENGTNPQTYHRYARQGFERSDGTRDYLSVTYERNRYWTTKEELERFLRERTLARLGRGHAPTPTTNVNLTAADRAEAELAASGW